MEPLSALALTGLWWLVSGAAIPSTIAGVALGGVIGNTTDRVFHQTLRSWHARLRGLHGRPENHHVAHALRRAQLKALRSVICDYREISASLPVNGSTKLREHFFDLSLIYCANSYKKCESNKNTLSLDVTQQLEPAIQGLFTGSLYGSDSPLRDGPADRKRDDIGRLAEDVVLEELRGALASTPLPAGFEQHFRNGGRGKSRFLEWFGIFVSDEIKTDEPFQKILTTGQLSRIEGLTFNTAVVLTSVGENLQKIVTDTAALLEYARATRAGVERIEKTLGTSGDRRTEPLANVAQEDRTSLDAALLQLERRLFTAALRSFDTLIERAPDQEDLYVYRTVATLHGIPLHKLRLEIAEQAVNALAVGLIRCSEPVLHATFLLLIRSLYFNKNGITWSGPSITKLSRIVKDGRSTQIRRLLDLLNLSHENFIKALYE